MARAIGRGGRDYPDFGVSNPSNTSILITDLSELAARLGSPSYFDRSGVILFSETFENGMRDWYATTSGDPAYVRLTAGYVAHGSYAVEMENSGVLTENAYMRKLLPFPYMSTVGFEFHLRHIADGERFVFQTIIYDTDHYHQMIIRIDSVNEELELQTTDGAYETIDISPYHSGLVSLFHAIKFTVNIDTGTYIRLSVDAIDYPVNTIPVYTDTPGAQPRIVIYTGLWGSDGEADHIVIDNIIVTLDEPS